MTDTTWLWVGFNVFVLGVVVLVLAASMVTSLLRPRRAQAKPRDAASEGSRPEPSSAGLPTGAHPF